MKVLLIDVNCKHSSTGKIVYDLYTELNNSGNEAAICYGRGPLIKEKNIFKFGIDIETLFHAGMTRLTGLTGFFSILSTFRLINYFEKFKPDVVHIHELHAYFVNIGRLMNYLKEKNIKTVWTFHCEFMYTGKCGHAHDCEKFKKECHNCPQLREYPTSLTFDFTRYMHTRKKQYFQGFNNLTIVTPSKWLANRVRYSFLAKKNIQVVFNGIDTSVFDYKDFSDLQTKHNITNEKIILSVGSNLMTLNKGGQYVIELAKRFTGQNYKFIMIGVDNIDNTVSDNVIMLQKIIDKNELVKYFSMADITLLTSKRETFSLVAIESILCNSYIIGFKAGAPEEVVPKDQGVFVKYGDLDALEHEIRSYLSMKQIDKKDKNNIELKKRFDNSRMFNEYLTIYKE